MYILFLYLYYVADIEHFIVTPIFFLFSGTCTDLRLDILLLNNILNNQSVLKKKTLLSL